jgi:hypothetical protein
MEHLAATVAFLLVSGLGLLVSLLVFRWMDPAPHRYDPARHYMRGPGPACRAKSGFRHSSAAR